MLAKQIIILAISSFLLKSHDTISPICEWFYKYQQYIQILMVVFSSRPFRFSLNPDWAFFRNFRDYVFCCLWLEFGQFAYEDSFILHKEFNILNSVNHSFGSILQIFGTFACTLPQAYLIETEIWSQINFIGITHRAFLTWNYANRYLLGGIQNMTSDRLINLITLEGYIYNFILKIDLC